MSYLSGIHQHKGRWFALVQCEFVSLLLYVGESEQAATEAYAAYMYPGITNPGN